MIDERFEKVQFVVEADDFSRHALWKEFVDQRKLIEKTDWQNDSGLLITVGNLIFPTVIYPVTMSFIFVRIKDVLVGFYYSPSRFVDHDMIDNWLKENCNPMYCQGTRRAHCDAMNFAHCYHYIIDPLVR